MTDKLIESVATALYDYKRPDYDPDFSDIHTSIKDQMEGCARAALAAIEASGHTIVPKYEARDSMYVSFLAQLPGKTT